MDFYGGGNLYNSLASFLEALHVGTMPESVELFYASGALGSIADIVTKAIDALVANPLDYLTDVLPDLAYTYGEVASSLQALLEQLGGLVSIELPSDFSGVVSMVGGLIGFEFPAFDVDYLARWAVLLLLKAAAPAAIAWRSTAIRPWFSRLL